MKSFILFPILFLGLNFYGAQLGSGAKTAAPIAVSPSSSPGNGLFDYDSVLQITLRGNIGDLLKNRSGKPKSYPLVLTYTQADSSAYSIPIEAKTRGHFRRIKGNCKYPPLMLQFPNEGPHLTSIFTEQKKLKLVMPCKDDSYIIREWLAYELSNLVTPMSFKARLVKVTLEDDDKKQESASFYGILLEEERQMASRNLMVPVERKLHPLQIQKDAFLRMAVFQYLIGNTDWSVQYLQNIKLMAVDSNSIPYAVPYDFDHSGIVNAPYAKPAEALKLKSTQERRYRGYCVNHVEKFEPIIVQYNLLKEDIYQLYTGCTLLDAKYRKSTLEFLDEFYATINNPKLWQQEFTYPCDPEGTGNVVIKGLQQD